MDLGIDIIVVYTVLLVVSLWCNGIVTVSRQDFRELFAPLANRRLLGGSLLIDVLLVPAVMVTLIFLLPGITDGMRIGLVLIAAASTGPIGAVLTRIVRGDVPLATSLITAFGVLNLVTVPLIGALLLGRTVPFPLVPVMSSMLQLVFLPLAIGTVWRRIAVKRKVALARREAQMRVLSVISTVFLAAAALVALAVDFVQVVKMLAGPIGVLALLTAAATTLAAFAVGDSRARRVTLTIVLNARAGGLALTVTALHFAHTPDVRATVVAFSIVTQLFPTLTVLIRRGLSGYSLDADDSAAPFFNRDGGR